MIRITKILYATDFSSHSNQAYFHAVALAEKHGASLTIVFVYSPGFTGPEASGQGDERAYWRNQLEQIRPVDVRIPVHHVFLEGDPAREIVRYATDAGMDLIVMGAYGHSRLQERILGGVTRGMLQSMTVPNLMSH